MPITVVFTVSHCAVVKSQIAPAHKYSMFKYHCYTNITMIKLWARARGCKFYIVNHGGVAHWIVEIPTEKLNTLFQLNYGECVRNWSSDFSS